MGFCTLPGDSVQIFKCKEGVSDSLTDSFLQDDCTVFCLTGTHLKYAIGITIVLFIYCFMAIMCRPISDKIMDYTNMKTFPIHVYLKGVLQMGLVVISYHFKTDYENIYAVCLLYTSDAADE